MTRKSTANKLDPSAGGGGGESTIWRNGNNDDGAPLGGQELHECRNSNDTDLVDVSLNQNNDADLLMTDDSKSGSGIICKTSSLVILADEIL